MAVSPRTAHAEWSWLFPQPQGHTLNDIVFLDNSTAVAVGGYGTVLVTHDTGATWNVDPGVLGITTNLLRVDRLGPTTVVAVGGNGVVLRSNDGGVTWTPSTSGTSVSLIDVSFADATHGIAVGGTTTLRTSDGGSSWLPATASAVLRSVHAVTASDAFAGGDQGKLLMTSDGGATWSPATSPVPPGYSMSITGLDFLDPMNGLAAAASGYDPNDSPIKSMWYLTDDGGATWSELQPFSSSNPSAEYTPREVLLASVDLMFGAVDVTCCILSAYDPAPTGELLASTNAGTTWAHNGTTHRVNGIARNDDGVVLGVGGDGIIYRRETDGTVARIGGTPQHHHAAGSASSFLDDMTGIVMSSDDYMYPASTFETSFAHTSDGGANWSYTAVSNVMGMDLVQMTSSDVYAVAVAYAGAVVLESTDGGANWTQIWAGASPYLWYTAIARGSSTRAVAVGGSGSALVIDNGVVTAVATGASVSLSDVAFASPTVVVAIGGTDVRRSIDGGQTWDPAAGPSPGLSRIAFATATTAFATSSAGIYRSEDTGDTWTLVEPVADLYNIDFADADNGMAVGKSGAALITHDGGNTWDPANAPTNRPLNHVTTFSGDHAFVSGSQLDLFEYDTRPDPSSVRMITKSAVELLPNRPNPFNPSTVIRFVLAERSHVRLTIHDVTGRLVAVLTEGVRDPGMHSVEWRAANVASGVYFCRLEAGRTSVSRKLVLLK